MEATDEGVNDMSLFRESKHQPVSGWVWIIVSGVIFLLPYILMSASANPNEYGEGIMYLCLVIFGIGFAIGVIRIAVAGAMYRQEEQNRRIIELLKQINDKTESPDRRHDD